MIMKKLLAILMSLCMILSFASCSGENETDGDINTSTPSSTPVSDEGKKYDTEWVFYWYLCGSDLETNGGFASGDLEELTKVTLPENVKVVIETGGAAQWQNELVDGSKIQRFVYDSTGLNLVDEQELANMGDPNTLADFLKFGTENYPANKSAVLFWNHGGGSVSGAAFDELHESDSLTLDEMSSALSSVFGEKADTPVLELVGFDTCLMATIDTAAAFSGYANYLVASEELEPGNGWNYTKLMSSLVEEPTMDGATLGKVICDTYVEGCEEVGTEAETTLSVTNLNKIENLLTAYDNFGKEALANACADPAFFSQFARVATATENYGGNTKEQGFTNMADLGHLARETAEILPDTSAAVLSALEECIEYKVNGPYRQEATGLSCYYSYNGDIDDFNGFVKVGAGDAFKYFYEYGLTGTLSEQGMQYISEMKYEEPKELTNLKTTDWENHPVDVDDEGNAILTLGKEANNILGGIYFQLYYVDPENDTMLFLGRDNDINADWENGVFKDNFRGVWGSIDGNLVYMEISYEGEDYNLYSVPVMLNDVEMNLCVAYDYKTEEYSILGARKPIDDNGMADKNLLEVKEGDTIKTIHYVTALSSESDELEAVEIDTITGTADTKFTESDLGDGQFVMMFEMEDAQGNTSYSDVITYNVENGEITTSVSVQ